MTTYATRPEVQPGARQVFKMRELSNDTARVMREISESGEPALITLRGRFVAVITPLTDGDLESKLISAALESGALETRQLLEAQETSPLSTQEAAQELGVEVPEYGDRDPSE
ncbi:hypothetical protein QBC31_43010 [Streptomyces sp. B21-079]|uniref:hypothetical protein n=1 Tax=Streptomyces sp. B21-079 TaxID=3039409 RepID=UPI002FF4000E